MCTIGLYFYELCFILTPGSSLGRAKIQTTRRDLTILHTKSLALKVGKNRQREADLSVTSAGQISAPKLVKPVLYCAITKCTISNRTTSWNICIRFVRFLYNKQ